MDTIFALSSGKGKSGVSVIRISGSIAYEALEVFGIKDLKARTANLRKLKDKNGDIIDSAIVITFEAPASFTGENIVELHIHGSIAVVSKVLDMLSNIKGFRHAEPGEFSKRAFDNDKMDLLQAEGLADLINSETDSQRIQAIRQMDGNFSDIYENWRNKIVELMAFIEAFVDFPDEDIPDDLEKASLKKTHELIAEIEEQVENKCAEKIHDGIRVVIAGKPNVGKSTLINLLTNRDLAIVSDIAGTTRDSLEAHFEIAGFPITLIDTAGIRETEDFIEKEGVRRTLEKIKNADFKILILDATDENIDESNVDESTIVIINKCDLNDANFNINNKNYRVIRSSLKNGEGVEEIKKTITELSEKFFNKGEAGIVTRSRHRHLLKEAVSGLKEFISSRENNSPIEMAAENLRVSANSMGRITGKIGVEDVLDKIFQEFCIGK